MNWSDKSILVTGGASFISSHLIDLLVSKGATGKGRIRVVDDLTSGKLANIQGHIDSGVVEFVKADLLEPGVPQAAVAGVREAPGVLVLFAGVDAKGSGVELRLSGVPIVGADGNADLAAPPATAELRISYAANVARPDIVRLPPGAF